MYCQKCRTPLKIDSSLEDLNPAAFDLLIGSANRSQQNAVATSKVNFPIDRKELYDSVNAKRMVPLQKRTVPGPVYADKTVENGEPGSSKHAPPDMSFIEITQSQVVLPSAVPPVTGKGAMKGTGRKDETEYSERDTLRHHLSKQERLFSILSSHSDIDHPICAECTSLLLQSFTARLAAATRERDAYAGFLKQLQQSASSHEPREDAKLQKELESLRGKDKKAYEELKQLEDEKTALESELADLEDESQQLSKEEDTFWVNRNAFDSEIHNLETELASLQQKYIHSQQHLEKLQRTNVYNDTFCIGHDGSFATINGLRLGRLPGQNVDWSEINAAWGQTLLLLATVAEKLNFSFQGYRLKPLGSTSRIEKLEYPQQAPSVNLRDSNEGQQRPRAPPANPQPKVTPLELFSSGETAIGRVFNHRKFDAGMVAFLDCLSQLGEHVERSAAAELERRTGGARNSPLKTAPPKRVLPYTIQGDKIGDNSIKLGVGFSQDESFTKACKYALTCCKFLLAHCSNVDNPRV